jgi:hypothetical protein
MNVLTNNDNDNLSQSQGDGLWNRSHGEAATVVVTDQLLKAKPAGCQRHQGRGTKYFTLRCLYALLGTWWLFRSLNCFF